MKILVSLNFKLDSMTIGLLDKVDFSLLFANVLPLNYMRWCS